MSNPIRSCAQCRSAKAKCDLVRPTCGRCRKRGTTCDGYTAEGSFIFRDETAHAQQLSQRARGRAPVEVFNVAFEPQQDPIPNINAVALQEQFSWLNERALAALPAQLKQDGEARAVQRFFANWVVYPNELSPGYMHHLPLLYETSADTSVLHFAVRAVAFADVRRHSSDSREYELKGLRSYSDAITRLRTGVQDPAILRDDQILAGLLLIDSFETLYMGRDEPLGLHDTALKYVLEARGTEQLYSARQFCLWRVAFYRLQARQLLRGEVGGQLQANLLESLNQERPDLRVMYHVSRIISLCARVNDILHPSIQEVGADAMADVTDILQDIRDLTSLIETWTSGVDNRLKPTLVAPESTIGVDPTITSTDDPMNDFSCPNMLQHHDVTVAFVWTFYAAAQMILREHTIRLLKLAATLSPTNAQQYSDRTHGEELAIDGLSSSIVRSFPKVGGLVTQWTETHHGPRYTQGCSLGPFLGMFAMIVVKRTEATSYEHKSFAGKVLTWLRRYNDMGELAT